jgi:23S rRNA (cytidine1920-2'-O)/16S rRNA (cytidine1409-2'-O)-methyltransferase
MRKSKSSQKTERIDSLIVEKGLVESREKAQALLMAGEVFVDGDVITKSGTRISVSSLIKIKERPIHVGRGGIKLAGALKAFSFNPRGLVILDVGASTGGFTDCLLQENASKVYALDVGRGQLHDKLIRDSRVISIEKTNARYGFELPELVDAITVDVSFISLRKILPEVIKHLKGSGPIVALVKPQFEAERNEVGRGGIIKDPFVHARILGRFIIWLTRSGIRLNGLTPSILVGTAGNKEFFVLLENDIKI